MKMCFILVQYFIFYNIFLELNLHKNELKTIFCPKHLFKSETLAEPPAFDGFFHTNVCHTNTLMVRTAQNKSNLSSLRFGDNRQRSTRTQTQQQVELSGQTDKTLYFTVRSQPRIHTSGSIHRRRGQKTERNFC